MTEQPSHRAAVEAVLSKIILPILNEHQIEGDERDLIESILEDVNLAQHMMPPPQIHVLPGSIKLYWMDDSVNMTIDFTRETRSAHVMASKIGDDGIVTKIEGFLEPDSVTLNMREGRPVEPYVKYFFCVPDEFMELVRAEEEFDEKFQPRLELGVYSKEHRGRVMWAWDEVYYDGPIAGYCYVDGQLCYFSCADQLEYSRNRIFEVRHLTVLDKLKARVRRLQFKIMYSKALRDVTPKIKKALGIKPFYERPGYNAEKAGEKMRKWMDSRKLAGYFTL